MFMTIPNTRQRKALANMTPGYPERKGTLLAGEKTIGELIVNGWVTVQETKPGDTRYSITPAGEAARSVKPAPAPPKRPPLKTIKPALKALDTRIVKPQQK